MRSTYSRKLGEKCALSSIAKTMPWKFSGQSVLWGGSPSIELKARLQQRHRQKSQRQTKGEVKE